MAWAEEPASPSFAKASSRLGGATPASRNSASIRSDAACWSGVRRTACPAPRTLSLSTTSTPAAAKRSSSARKTRSSRLPSRVRSSSFDIPGLRGSRAWKAASAASASSAEASPRSPRGRTTPGRRRRRARCATRSWRCRAERLGAERRPGPELRRPHPAPADALDVGLEDRRRGARLEGPETRREGRAPPRLRRGDVEELAAADRHHRGIAPDDVAVAGQRHDRRLEPQLDVARLTRLDGGRRHGVHARHDLARPDVEAHALARPERGRRVVQELARRVEHVGGLEEARQREHVAALDRRALDALEVHGRALAGNRRRDGLPVRLDAAHLGLEPVGVHLDPLVQGELAGGHRPGHHRAEPPDREDAVDRQAEGGIGPARGTARARRGERLAQRRQPLARLGRDGKDRRAVEKRPAQEAPDVLLDQLQPLGLGQIRLGQHDEAARGRGAAGRSRDAPASAASRPRPPR